MTSGDAVERADGDVAGSATVLPNVTEDYVHRIGRYRALAPQVRQRPTCSISRNLRGIPRGRSCCVSNPP
jgi:hypothetical protein